MPSVTQAGEPRASRDARRAHMGIAQLWAVAGVGLSAGLVSLQPLGAADLAYLVRAGEVMIDRGGVLRTDVMLTWTLGKEWLNQQWGFELLVAFAFRGAGWLGLAVVRAALVAVILELVYLGCRRAGAGRRTSALLTVGSLLLLAPGLNLRSQLAGMACFAAVLWLVEGRREHPGRLAWAPAVVLVWANLHGSFFLGPLLLGLAWLEDRFHRRPDGRRTFLVAAASVAATTISPFGIGTWRYVANVAGDPLVRDVVTEWQAPTLRLLPGAAFLVSLVVMLLLVGRRSEPEDRVAVVRLLVIAAIGLASLRGTLWWALLAPVTAARWLPEVREGAPDPRGRVNVAIAAMLILASISPMALWFPHADREDPGPLMTFAPPGITEEMGRLLQPGERFFHPQEWGSWFELALPENPASVDPRFELIPPQRWREYVAISGGRADWAHILDTWGVRVLVLSREQQAQLIPIALEAPDWRLVYEDDDGLVLIRA
jgi:hypothetical protein